MAKLNYYKNLDFQTITDNRKFWKMIKTVFTDKVQLTPRKSLAENGEIVTDGQKLAEIINEYFANITNDLEITENETHLTHTMETNDPID